MYAGVSRSLRAGLVLSLLAIWPHLDAQDGPLTLEGPPAPTAADTEAQTFLNLLVLDEFEQNITGIRRRPALVRIRELCAEKKSSYALRVFHGYFFDKLRNPVNYGLSYHALSPYVAGVTPSSKWPTTALSPNPELKKVLATADRLMAGQVWLDGKYGAIGEPGAVDWTLKPAPSPRDPKPGPYGQLVFAGAFRPLAQAYLLTGETRYLERWSAYMLDWATRCDYLGTIHPWMVSDRDNGAVGNTVQTMRVLAGLAQAMPVAHRELIPPQTLAAILSALLHRHILPSVAYIRSNTHNWTPSPQLMLVALFFDEFRVAPDIFREARRRWIEDHAVTQNLRDGAENQQDPWYNENYLHVAEVLRLMDDRDPVVAWDEVGFIKDLRFDNDWRRELQTHLDARIRYFIHIRTPAGEYPIGIRGGDKRQAARPPYSLAPSAYDDPVNRGILGQGPPPDYRSDAFPYAGYFLVRRGWKRDSGYGFLFCSPQPGAYGAFRSRSNNNSFGLMDFGDELLVADTTGHYMYPSSPIRVDGANQFFHAGIYKVGPPSAHKVYQVSAWTEPAAWRWHESERFNLMEGVYAGPYARPVTATREASQYGDDESLQDTLGEDQSSRGLTHQRLVQYVVAANLWIVTDRITTAGAHRYDQVWRLPVKPGNVAAFLEDAITVNAETRQITTQDTTPQKANISLYQFTAASLRYAETITPKAPGNHYQVYGWKEITAIWKGEGPQQVITAIYPRAPGANDLRDVVSLADGFDASTPDGVTLQYRAAAFGTGDWTLGDRLRAQAGSVLLVGDAALLTDCKSAWLDGKPVTLPAPDLELNLALGTATQIYRPISPVDVQPAREALLPSEPVSLHCSTPGVEIRYTLDGSEPTPASTLYVAPFTLRHSSTVRARAYRPGQKANPPNLAGTLATVSTDAVFRVQGPVAARPTPRLSGGGLRYRYFESADWQRLWLYRDELAPTRNGTAAIFDLSIIPESNAPVGDAAAPRKRYFAIEYSGYIQVPETGVYTFHAPREWVYPDTEAGYDLQVFVGDRMVPYGPRKQAYGLNQWYPSTRLHGLGNWGIALEKGYHPITIQYVDLRTDSAKRLNRRGVRPYIWPGVTPDLRVSGPGLDGPQPIPANWLEH